MNSRALDVGASDFQAGSSLSLREKCYPDWYNQRKHDDSYMADRIHEGKSAESEAKCTNIDARLSREECALGEETSYRAPRLEIRVRTFILRLRLECKKSE